jgi:hypothetical protein
MNRFSQIAFFALAAFAVIFAGATTDRSTVAVLGQPGDGGGCSSGCSVGGHGTGGENSGGNAKGFHDSGPDPDHPGELVNNSGTDFSGHLVATDEATGETIGSKSGAFPAPGINDDVGHSTFGGVCNGRQSLC